MKLYLAARYSRRLELCGYREQLEALGFEVTSRWLDGEHAQLDGQWAGLPTETVSEWARDDMEDIESAEFFILFSEEPGNGGRRGGRHVELGYAIASGAQCMIVGPRENTFHCLRDIQVFPTFKECIQFLEELRRDQIQDEIERDS